MMRRMVYLVGTLGLVLLLSFFIYQNQEEKVPSKTEVFKKMEVIKKKEKFRYQPVLKKEKKKSRVFSKPEDKVKKIEKKKELKTVENLTEISLEELNKISLKKAPEETETEREFKTVPPPQRMKELIEKKAVIY